MTVTGRRGAPRRGGPLVKDTTPASSRNGSRMPDHPRPGRKNKPQKSDDEKGKPSLAYVVSVIGVMVLIGAGLAIYLNEWPWYVGSPAILIVGAIAYAWYRQMRSPKTDVAEKPAVDSDPEAPAKKERIVRTAPNGAVIPTMGWPRVVYAQRKLRGRPDLVPELSKKEKRIRSEEAALEEQRQLDEDRYTFIKKASNSWGAHIDGKDQRWTAFRCVIGVFNEKGGVGKTTIATEVADELAEADASVLLMPLAANDGSTGYKAGTNDEDTLSCEQIYNELQRLTENGTKKADAETLKSLLNKNESGVYVASQVALPSSFGATKVRWMMQQLREMFQYIILDTGNDISRRAGQGLPQGGNVIFAAGSECDVIIFVSNASIPDSPQMMGKSMDSLANLNDKSKLSRAITVVNAVNLPDDTEARAEIMRHWVTVAESKVNAHYQPIGPRDFEYRVIYHGNGRPKTGELILFPWDDHVSASPQISLRKLGSQTRPVLVRLVFEAITRAGENKGTDFSLLENILHIKRESLSHLPFDDVTDEYLDAQLAALADAR